MCLVFTESEKHQPVLGTSFKMMIGRLNFEGVMRKLIKNLKNNRKFEKNFQIKTPFE